MGLYGPQVECPQVHAVSVLNAGRSSCHQGCSHAATAGLQCKLQLCIVAAVHVPIMACQRIVLECFAMLGRWTTHWLICHNQLVWAGLVLILLNIQTMVLPQTSLLSVRSWYSWNALKLVAPLDC